MSLDTILLVQAILFLAYGIGFVLSPPAVLSLYGKTLEPLGVVMCRYLGAGLIGIALACLLMRGAPAGEALKGVVQPAPPALGVLKQVTTALAVDVDDAVSGHRPSLQASGAAAVSAAPGSGV